MAQQVVITLHVLTDGIYPPIRTIRLSPDRPSIPVGRASKSVNKGLLGAEDNAWFDSPVMSRDHAELLFDKDSMTVKIQDLSSMHGTTVNDARLETKTLRVVNRGDILVFGAEVRRGPETFPPCFFKIDYEFTHWTRGFQFPDSSDIEDEQDMSEEETGQLEDNTPAESPVPKYSASIEAIDLTGDKPTEKRSDPVDAIDAIDLTRDDTVPPRTDIAVVEAELTTQEKFPADPPASRVVEGCTVVRTFVDSDSEDDDESSEEEYEEQRYYESEDGSVNDGSDKENNENDLEVDDQETDEEGGESMSDWVPENNPDRVDTSAHPDTTSCEAALHSCEHSNPMTARMFYDNKDIPISNMRTPMRGLSETSLSVEHCYDGSPSAAWDAGLSDSAGEEPSSVGVSKPMEPTITLLGSTFYPTSQLALYPRATVSQGQAPERQPSPSDAAMVKSMGQTQTIPHQSSANFPSAPQAINSTTVHHLPNPEWGNVGPTTMGNQTKQDPLNAKKENLCSRSQYTEASLWGDRAPVGVNLNMASHQYNGHPAPPPSEVAGSQSYPFNRLQPSIQDKIREMAQREQGLERMMEQQRMIEQQRLASNHQMLAHQMAQQRLYFQRALAAQVNARAAVHNQTNLAQSACPLSKAGAHHNSDNMNGIPKSTREESPGIDSTSAFTYNKTKSSKEMASRPPIDIGEGLESKKTPEANSKPPKRKFGELEKEVRDWAETTVHSTGRGNIPSEAADAVNIHAVSEEPQSSQTDPFHSVGQQERSTKRLKRFVEAAGYAALGGLAVGAGLFSVLVATAPEFL